MQQNGPKALRLARAITARPARGLRGDTAARDLPPSPRCSRVPMTAAAIANSSSAASGLGAFNPSQERIRQLTVRARQVRCEFKHEPEPLSREFRVEGGNSGDVAARAAQAGDQPDFDRVGSNAEDDRAARAD